jgi:hypothetical protein
MMLTILILVGCITTLAMLLFVIAVIGIRQEPPAEELSEQAPTLIAALARRLLGLYVRKPYSPPDGDQYQGRAWMHTTPFAGPMDESSLK